MSFRLLLDENVEHELLDRLATAGHDIEHVEFVSKLGKSANDAAIAAYSVETDRLILTYDDDFVKRVDETAYRGVLYVPDTSLRTDDIRAIVEEISRYYPQREIDGFVYAGSEWL